MKFNLISTGAFLLAALGTGATSETSVQKTSTEGTQKEFITQEVAFPILNGLTTSLVVCTKDNILPWQDEFHRGGTGYIDGIKPDDLKQPIMCGVDPWGRYFLALKYTCRGQEEGGEDKKKTIGAVALFQRYTGENLIVPGGHFQPVGCHGSLGPIDPLDSKTFSEDFSRFVGGEKVEYYDWSEEKITMELCNKQSCPDPFLRIAAPDSVELVVTGS